MKYLAVHGTPDPETILSFEGGRVAYFTDSREVAKDFAYCKDAGGLLRGEKATLIHACITLDNPLSVSEDEWLEKADVCYIDKNKLKSEGYDGVICKNSFGISYYAVFYSHQCEILDREFLNE